MFESKHPRLLLNEIKWRFDLGKCKVYYIHRGAPGDIRVVDGTEIKNIERGFLILKGVEQDVYIPYHRIFRIDFEDQTIFERAARKPLTKLSH
ncbi:MAG: RNA repair domain-containing protein [Candidatus Methanoperedens sp.]|nr:RNA repair domain-containing protein [Candidatus Methanoperedens sp.]